VDSTSSLQIKGRSSNTSKGKYPLKIIKRSEMRVHNKKWKKYRKPEIPLL